MRGERLALSRQNQEKLFEQFDQGTEILQSAMTSSYLDAFLENAENILDDCKVRVEDGLPNEEDKQKLEQIYQSLNVDDLTPEDWRRLVELSFLKVIRKDAIQANHQMTPETIGMIFVALIERIVKLGRDCRILDPVVGTGNLLTTVINDLKPTVAGSIEGFGIDNDESMLAVASVSTGLQKQSVELLHQDAIQALDVPSVDLVVADLPIGYYPLDKNTVNYKTRAKKGHSYVHHLLIEQSMNYLKAGGWGFFLIPSNLFQTKESAGFVKWIQSVAHMQGLINLPEDIFANQAAAKSILILQRQGGGSKQAAQVLLGTFPSFKQVAELKRFMGQIDQWAVDNLN